MSDSALAVQKAVYDAVSAALTPTPVYDHIPQDTAALFVRIGDSGILPDDTKTGSGVRHTVQIDVFSSSRGLKEVKTTMGTIYNTLQRQRLTVTGFDSQELQFDFSDSFIEPTGARGVMRFSIPTQPE